MTTVLHSQGGAPPAGSATSRRKFSASLRVSSENGEIHSRAVAPRSPRREGCRSAGLFLCCGSGLRRRQMMLLEAHDCGESNRAAPGRASGCYRAGMRISLCEWHHGVAT